MENSNYQISNIRKKNLSFVRVKVFNKYNNYVKVVLNLCKTSSKQMKTNENSLA